MKDQGLKVSGNKKQLIDRLASVFSQPEFSSAVSKHSAIYDNDVFENKEHEDNFENEFPSEMFILLEESHTTINVTDKKINVGGEEFLIPIAFYHYLKNHQLITNSMLIFVNFTSILAANLLFIDRDPLLFAYILSEIYPHYEKPTEEVPTDQLADELLFFQCQSNNWVSPYEMYVS